MGGVTTQVPMANGSSDIQIQPTSLMTQCSKVLNVFEQRTEFLFFGQNDV